MEQSYHRVHMQVHICLIGVISLANGHEFFHSNTDYLRSWLGPNWGSILNWISAIYIPLKVSMVTLSYFKGDTLILLIHMSQDFLPFSWQKEYIDNDYQTSSFKVYSWFWRLSFIQVDGLSIQCFLHGSLTCIFWIG